MLNKFSFRDKKAQDDKKELELDTELIPRHVAIIMDGNGRWAKKRNLPRIAGHNEGMKVVKKVVREADRLGVQALTLYAFSTENWKRPKPEVEFLMRLPGQFLTSYLTELIENNVRVEVMGDTSPIPDHTKKAVLTAKKKTEHNTGLVLNFALNYGSRHEIVEAVKRIAHDVQTKSLEQKNISEETISDYMISSHLPDPDLLIRTSGEIRLSNFMLWQLAYTEFWFTDVLWPDFSEQTFRDALAHYANRNRRYGGVEN